MPESASPENHELAGRLLVGKELCLDLARKHASTIAQISKRTEVQFHYRAIAKLLYCRRVKRISQFQQVMRKKAVERFLKSRHQEERLEADLLAVYNAPHYSVDRRKAALQEIGDLRKQWEKLAEQQHAEVVELSIRRTHYPSKSQRLISRFKSIGRDKFFDRIDSVVRRYLKARVEGAHWPVSRPDTQLGVSMSLLQLLALEWLRDKDALWRFLEACLSRWEAVTDPNGIHYQNVLMHNICETRIALDANGNNVVDPNKKILPQVTVWMKDIGAFVEPNQSAVDCLRQRSSRNIREAKAEFENKSSVTDLGTTHP
jgi:hypothetical protein